MQIDLDPKMIGLRYPMDVHLVGDAAETLRALIPHLRRKDDRSWREMLEREIEEWWRVLGERAMLDGDPINPQRVAHELSARSGWGRRSRPSPPVVHGSDRRALAAVFKDELRKLFPDDEDARRLAGQVYHFSDFFEQVAGDYEPPQLERRALVHGHCHHKATGGLEGELSLLRRLGLDLDAPESGCCGMAGSFGFEAGHYDVSLACGERVLLPKVREISDDTLIVANGFSCKTQIEQGGTGRRALHVAEVMKLARERPSSPGRPEELLPPAPAPASGRAPLAALSGVALVAGAAAWWSKERRSR